MIIVAHLYAWCNSRYSAGRRGLFTIVALLAVFGMFAPHVLQRFDLDVWAGG